MRLGSGRRPSEEVDAVSGSPFRIVAYFLKPYRKRYLFLAAVMLLTSLLESFSVAAFFPLFSSLTESGESTSGLLSWMTKAADAMPGSDPIVSAAILLAILFTAKAAFTLVRDWLSADASGRVLFDIKNQIMLRYGAAPYQLFLEKKQGTLIYNGLVAPHKVAMLLLRAPQMAAEALRILAVGTVLVAVLPGAALGAAVMGLIYFRLIRHLAKKVSYTAGKGRAQAGAAEAVIANEFFNGIMQIITFRTVGRWLDRFRRETRTYSDLFAKDLFWLGVPRSVMEFAALVVMLGAVLIVYAQNPEAFTSSLPEMGVVAMGLLQLLPAATTLGRLRMEVMGLLPDAERVQRALTEPIPVRREGHLVAGSFEKAIVFDDVWFSHDGREPVLKGVDLTVEKGKVTAIVGMSGAGKTTMLRLLIGLLEPSRGNVRWDGVPLHDYKSESWLSRIGFVSQDPFIFHATIAENITFWRDGCSREMVIEAASMAHAHDFITELPEGYDTVVGERGMRLSGGQQQRLCIARALLAAPEILIFDEATSSLDRVSEALIQQTITELSRDYTIVIVAHRPATIAAADKIAVLQDGRVVEEGQHVDLLKNGCQYAQLFAGVG